MQPDFLWSARRDSGDNYSMYDSVRGAGKEMRNAETGAEYSRSDNIQALQSNGFQVGTDSQVNANNGTYVSWAWKAGGSASNNTDGTVTVSLSVNTTAGFSVGTYTGTSANNTFGHGLGAIPDWLMIKNRSSGSRKWALWHKNLTGTNKYLAIERI